MGAIRRSEVGVLGLSVVLITGALVAGAVVFPGRVASQSEAEGVLDSVAASRGATYRARQLVVYLGLPQSAAVLDVQSRPGGTYVRAEAGTDVTHVWRDRGHGLLADADARIEDAAPPPVRLDPDAVMEKYEVEVGEPVEQLGVRVTPVDLVRRIDRRLVERLWVASDTGVVYRRELFGRTGTLVGMSQVIEMHWGEAGSDEPPGRGETSKVKISDPEDAPTELAYGYRLLRGYRFEAEGEPVRHWVYTDGIHALSVFRRDGSADPPGSFREVELPDGTAWEGPGPGMWMWEGDEATWIVVAEEPQLDIAELAEPFPRGGPSIPSRLGSWWARAWHWVLDLF